MYTFSEERGYQCSYTTTTTVETHQCSAQTFQRSTREVQWEFTRDGYSQVKASDALFEEDAPLNAPKTLPRRSEQETEYQQCQTWYVPNKPVEKPSRSQEYRAPHKRYAGYDRTHNKNGRSNIRGHTISSSGDSSHYAQSRSQSRQRQYCQVPSHHQRSASHASYTSNPAPRVSRERTQQRPALMNVVNLTKTSRRTSTRKQATAQRQAAPAPAPQREPQVCRKVRGKWIKGDVAPKPKICFQFLNHGTCSFGDRCKFEHVTKKTNRRGPRNPLNRTQPRYNNRRQQQTTAPAKTSFNARNRFVFDDGNGRAW
jgi:hypothetical protein